MRSYHTLEEEIDAVQRYLEGESVITQGKITREFYLDPEVDTETIVPSSLLQVFVENSLRQAIAHDQNEAVLHISINRSKLGTLIMVADSGFRNRNGHHVEQTQSEGIKMLNSYLPIFNRQHRVSVSYKMLSLNSENGSPGARVLITIKS
jgi:LytS/YehU family sensor histidine kinase